MTFKVVCVGCGHKWFVKVVLAGMPMCPKCYSPGIVSKVAARP